MTHRHPRLNRALDVLGDEILGIVVFTLLGFASWLALTLVLTVAAKFGSLLWDNVALTVAALVLWHYRKWLFRRGGKAPMKRRE